MSAMACMDFTEMKCLQSLRVAYPALASELFYKNFPHIASEKSVHVAALSERPGSLQESGCSCEQ